MTPYCFLGTNGSIGKFMGSLKYIKQAYPSIEKVAIVMPDNDTITFLQPLYQTAAAAEGLTLIDEPILNPNEMQDFSPIVAKINTLKESEAICHTNGVSQKNGAKPRRVYKRLKGFPVSTNKIKRLLFVQRYI